MTGNPKVTNIAKRRYWGIREGNAEPIFTGTFDECWKELVRRFAKFTLKELAVDNIRIARVK